MLQVALVNVDEVLHSGDVDETSGFKRNVELLTARQVVEQYPEAGFSQNALWRWAREGLMECVKLPSGRVRFRRADIEALLVPTVETSDRPLPGLGHVRG